MQDPITDIRRDLARLQHLINEWKQKERSQAGNHAFRIHLTLCAHEERMRRILQ